VKDPTYTHCSVCGRMILARKGDGMIAKHLAGGTLKSPAWCEGSDKPPFKPDDTTPEDTQDEPNRGWN